MSDGFILEVRLPEYDTYQDGVQLGVGVAQFSEVKLV